jgi:hypothetical protein
VPDDPRGLDSWLSYVIPSSFNIWLFNIAMGNDPFIDGLPIKNGGSFHGELLNNQRVTYGKSRV